MENLLLLPTGRLAVDAAGLECLLRANRPLRLSRGRGRRIRCTAGCAWITAPGMLEDVILRAGDAWQVHTDALVLVEAIDSAVVEIDAVRDQSTSPST